MNKDDPCPTACMLDSCVLFYYCFTLMTMANINGLFSPLDWVKWKLLHRLHFWFCPQTFCI